MATYGGSSSSSAGDTIAAPAGVPGAGSAIVPVRVSGPLCSDVAEAVLVPPPSTRPLRPRVASLRKIVDRRTGLPLDEAVVLWFPGPGSYTGEDMLEFHLHGGRAVVNGVTELLTGACGARLAEPGEFTRRAFEAGRMDLTEAEAVVDLLNADTDDQRTLALSQLGGSLRGLYDGWAARLRMLLAHAEAVIDMGDDEEDVGDGVWAGCADAAAALAAEMRSHLEDGRRGELIRSGLTVALVGAPNAGKSSLVNRLARTDVAIVSATPGTTRDAVAVRLNVRGVPVTVVDTAGMRESADDIERQGIARARARAGEADVVAIVCEAAAGAQEAVRGAEEVAHAVLLAAGVGGRPAPGPGPPPGLPSLAALSAQKHVAVVLSKCDQGEADVEGVTALLAAGGAASVACVPTSAQEGHREGVTALEAMMADSVGRLAGMGDGGPVLTRERHRTQVEHCVASLSRFCEAVAGGAPADMASEELRLAVGALARVTGRVDVEGVLDDVFSTFCVGK